MTAFVFTGPSLPAHAARTIFDAVYLPPASQGDVLRVLGRQPSAIGIVDGTFERMPAVWHKEILWALSRGIPVFGAASMGALRAAELAAFGMTGVGSVFERFHSGELDGDDEVAVAHGDSRAGFAAMSEALVVIRATLELAVSEGVLGETDREALVAAAKARYYPERCWPAVLDDGCALGLDPAMLDRLRRWLPGRTVDCKRDDAVAMLRTMRAHAQDGSPPARVAFAFEHTESFARALDSAGRMHSDDGLTIDPQRVLDEVRLAGGRLAGLMHEALLRALAEQEARRNGVTPATRDLDAARCALAARVEPDDLDAWRAEQDLTDAGLQGLLKTEALVSWAERAFSDEIVRRAVDGLRMSGDYPGLLARARDKDRVLEERGLLDAPLQRTGLDRDGLVAWYVRSRPEASLPSDPTELARTLGLPDVDGLEQLLLRERLYAACEHTIAV